LVFCLYHCNVIHDIIIVKNSLFRTSYLCERSKVIELDPKNAKAYISRGVAKLQLNAHESAIADIQQAARLGQADAQKILRDKGYSW